MREKLIDVFMHLDRHIQNRDEYGICYTSDFAEAVETVLAMLKSQDANGVTVQQWIPVTERKPDLELVEVKNQDMDLFPCLVSKVSQGQCRKTVVTKAWWDGLHFMDSDCIYITKYVTHWMPLPQPPKGE